MTTYHAIYYGLILAAILQLTVACLNLGLVKLLGWRDLLQKVPLLFKEVFTVHMWFISVTLAVFGVLTCRFAHDMTEHNNDVATWLAGGIGVFWLIRWVMQFTYYSSSHWRGQIKPTAVHIGLLFAYGCLSTVYLVAACGIGGAS